MCIRGHLYSRPVCYNINEDRRKDLKLESNQNPIFTDTSVPDIFISEYLPLLSPQAVKFYLYVAYIASGKKNVNEADIQSRTGTDKEGVQVILTELASYGLISFTEKGFTIEDVKEMQIKKMYRPVTSVDPSAIGKGKLRNEKERMMADISKTFFSGLMSPSWYYEIESWFERYRFEPQVVYALFNECKRRKKLDSKAYISKVAANWASHGVITYEDLNKYSATYDKVKLLSGKIGRKLRKSITEYDEEIISKWVEKMGYDFEIIEIALRKTSKLAHPNLRYSDKLLEEWFSHGLKTAESINEYEEKKAAKYARTRTSKSRSTADNVGNFNQRQYTEDYLEMMIDDITPETEEAENEPSD